MLSLQAQVRAEEALLREELETQLEDGSRALEEVRQKAHELEVTPSSPAHVAHRPGVSLGVGFRMASFSTGICRTDTEGSAQVCHARGARPILHASLSAIEPFCG